MGRVVGGEGGGEEGGKGSGREDVLVGSDAEFYLLLLGLGVVQSDILLLDFF